MSTNVIRELAAEIVLQVHRGVWFTTEVEQFLRNELWHRPRPVASELLEAAQTAVSFMRCIEWTDESTATESANIEELLDKAIAKTEDAAAIEVKS
jgi:translation initiation factor 2B subunit (eIF-2B alpha/beta/delta family)